MPKPKETFNGNSPKNARIKIDYSKTKPKVTFSYPSKDHQVEGSMFFTIFIIWCLINTPLLVYLSAKNEISSVEEEKYINEVNLSNYNLSNYESFLEYTKDSNILNNTFNIINNPDKSAEVKEAFERLKFPLFLLVYLFFVPWILFYLPFKKKWQRVYPKFQGWKEKKKITTLNSKDIKQENKLYYCELPIFSNIILDYKATEDFSKYLNLFEIKEHKFKYYYKKRRKLNKKRKERRKKEELNEWLWYARFYFKQKPTKGKITIIYK